MIFFTVDEDLNKDFGNEKVALEKITTAIH